MSVVATRGTHSVSGQEDNLRPAVEALQTQVSELQTVVAGGGEERPVTATVGANRGSTPASTSVVDPSASSSTRGLTRDDPIPVRRSVRIGDFKVRVVEVNRDAEALVLQENQYNDPALPGNRMVLVTLVVTYVGTETGQPAFQLGMKVVGNKNKAYDTYSEESRCGVIPNDLSNVPELFPDGNVTAAQCWQVPADEVDSLVLIIEPSLSFDDSDRRYFALT